MSSTWAIDVETNIYAIVKQRALKQLVKRYPSISDTNFTMDNIVSADAEFPNIYIHFMPSIEVGNDLVNQDINAIRSTVRVDVTVSKSDGLSGARFVSGVMLEEFKKLGYNINSLPEFNGNTVDTKRMIFQGSRIIGANDII